MAKQRQAKGAQSGSTGKPKGRRRVTPKTKADAPGVEGAGLGHNSAAADRDLSFEQERDLFASHRQAWNGWMAKRKVLEQTERSLKVALKADGFTVKQMQIADDLLTLKGEKKISSEVEDRLRVAKLIGHPMGAQMDLFTQAPPMASTKDAAFERGREDSLANQPRKPPPDLSAPGTEGYDAYMAGYNEHQGELLRTFKVGVAPDGGEQIVSGERVSREEFRRRLKQLDQPPAAQEAS